MNKQVTIDILRAIDSSAINPSQEEKQLADDVYYWLDQNLPENVWYKSWNAWNEKTWGNVYNYLMSQKETIEKVLGLYISEDKVSYK